MAPPITACGLRLDDEAVRTAVALPLRTTLCVPHTIMSFGCVVGLYLWLFPSHLHAELAASRKYEKYANLPNAHIFQPI